MSIKNASIASVNMNGFFCRYRSLEYEKLKSHAMSTSVLLFCRFCICVENPRLDFYGFEMFECFHALSDHKNSIEFHKIFNGRF